MVLELRSYKQKASSLAQYIATAQESPDAITLQETSSPVKLPGFITYEYELSHSLTTLISKPCTAIQHPLQLAEKIGILTEIVPRKVKAFTY